MSDEITPALTPDEWAKVQEQVVRSMRHDRLEWSLRRPFGYKGQETGVQLGWSWTGLNVIAEHSCAGLDPQWTHAIAALCLYQQPFGFTPEDVALCDLIASIERAFGPAVGNWLTEADRLALRHLRNRLAALLPPSAPTP